MLLIIFLTYKSQPKALNINNTRRRQDLNLRGLPQRMSRYHSLILKSSKHPSYMKSRIRRLEPDSATPALCDKYTKQNNKFIGYYISFQQFL